MSAGAFWDALQAALDARRDPLDEPAVAEHLLEHPADAAPLLDLLDRLRAVERAPRAIPAPRARAWPAPLVAAAGVLLALGLALAAGRRAHPAPGAAPASFGRVEAWRVTVEHRGPASTTRIVHEDGRLTVEEQGATRTADLGPLTYTLTHETRTRRP